MRTSDRHIDAEELDRLFDEGKVDILQYFDIENGVRPNLSRQSVVIDLLPATIEAVEATASHRGVEVHDVIEGWVEERAHAAA